MNIKGIIYKISEVVRVNDTMKKRNFIVKTEETYPQHVSMDFLKDKVDLLNLLNVGDKVSVEFNINGRISNHPETGEERVFNNLVAWKIEKIS